nr:hypothetical protein [Tanacetum cinerariifolium]
MVNLEFSDTNNMVAYLEKPEGSEGFHQIVDSLNASHIRYALTKNPTIYVSLINQFWETAIARTHDKGEIKITTTIDGKIKIVTEASVRRHLRLADSDGISSLPTIDIFEQLSLMGCSINLTTTFLPILKNPIRQETEVLKPSSPSHTNVANAAASTGRKIAEIDQDPAISLVQHDAQTQGSTASLEVKTSGVFVDDTAAETLVYIRKSEAKAKDKGKGITEESESRMIKTKRTKRQQEQERLGLEGAQLKKLSFDEIKDLFEITIRRVNTFVPMETKVRRGVLELVEDSSQAAIREAGEYKERDIWVELKRLFEPDADDELWKSQKHIHHGDMTWRLYDICGVHHVSIKDGVDIYMLVEREYPLSRGVPTLMLVVKLILDQNIFEAVSDQVAKCTVDNLKHKELDASLTAELERYKERVKTFEQRLNEVLVYIIVTCPGLLKPSEKLVAITPLNKNKKVGFTECATSSSNTRKQFSSGPAPQLMTPGTISSGLRPNHIPQPPYVPPTKNDKDLLFKPMFDDYFNPPLSFVSPVQAAAAPRPVDLASSPSSTTIDQDESSLNSTSLGLSSNVQSSHTPIEILGKWTKNHPLANVIRDPSRSVSTTKQLKTDAIWCYFDAFLTFVKPKNFKEAMLESAWIEEMQEEIHEFEQLEVYELVHYPDLVMLIKLKWIFKVKKDEFGGVL